MKTVRVESHTEIPDHERTIVYIWNVIASNTTDANKCDAINGMCCCVEGRGNDNLVRIERGRSVEVLK